jgi:GWxTD domain-containing protein
MAIVPFLKMASCSLLTTILFLSTASSQNQPFPKPSPDAPVEGKYQLWLDRDARWIIAPEERTVFSGLSRNQERDRFIEQFWLRRDPTPDTKENEYKEEHYRRIAYASEHFATKIPSFSAKEIPGWLTDRGRIYIVFGPPDAIATVPAERSSLKRPMTVWHYRSIDGRETDLKFVDVCSCGDFRLEAMGKN